MGILDDDRPVKAIWTRDPEDYGATVLVGCGGVTKIEAYGEPGQGAYVPWFAVWKGDVIDSRYNAALCVLVEYEDVPDVAFD